MNMKESEIPKYLAEELSKEPFNLNLNLISFTSLKGDALMQVIKKAIVNSDVQHKKLKRLKQISAFCVCIRFSSQCWFIFIQSCKRCLPLAPSMRN